MSLIIAGTVRVRPEVLADFRPHMRAMLDASRAEDVLDPGLIRVFEAWRDQAALDAHFKTPHMATWRSHWPAFGVSDRRLFAYEIASERQL